MSRPLGSIACPCLSCVLTESHACTWRDSPGGPDGAGETDPGPRVSLGAVSYGSCAHGAREHLWPDVGAGPWQRTSWLIHVQFLLLQKKEWTWDETKMLVMQDPIYR